MAYPASTKTLHELLTLADGEAIRMKSTVQQYRNASAAGPVQREAILKLVGWLDRAIGVWDAAVARGADIVSYAQSQKGVTFNLGAEFTAMRAAAVDLRDWLAALNADTGSYSELVNVSSDRLAEFRTKADAFIATVG